MNRPRGYWLPVLHWHIPWVLHHEYWPHGESTLLEVVFMSYLPQLMHFETLMKEGRKHVMTVSVTPVLLAQLRHPDLYDAVRYYGELRLDRIHHLLQKKNLDPQKERIVDWWRSIIAHRLRYWEEIGGDILNRLKTLHEQETIELMTSVSTHPYLPFTGWDTLIRLHLRWGLKIFRDIFSFYPQGIWLPEMAYRPTGEWKPAVRTADVPSRQRAGLEKFLVQEGIAYTFLDAPLIPGWTYHFEPGWKAIRSTIESGKGSLQFPLKKIIRSETPATPYEPFGFLENPTCIVFFRDPITSAQVWARDVGYPGDADYLEFHKIDDESGLKLWRVTGVRSGLGEKEWYIPEWALGKVRNHAQHFVQVLERTTRHVLDTVPEPSIIVSAFDGELLGHWWFEGVRWMRHVLALLGSRCTIQPTTPSVFLSEYGPRSLLQPYEGSWGEGNSHHVWVQPQTEFMWNRIYHIEKSFMTFLLSRVSHPEELSEAQFHALRVLCSEWVLLEASDWPFLLTTGQASEYAVKRFQEHADACEYLIRMFERAEFSESWIRSRMILNDFDLTFHVSIFDDIFDKEEVSFIQSYMS